MPQFTSLENLIAAFVEYKRQNERQVAVNTDKEHIIITCIWDGKHFSHYVIDKRQEQEILQDVVYRFDYMSEDDRIDETYTVEEFIDDIFFLKFQVD
jgi:hypothetical protein